MSMERAHRPRRKTPRQCAVIELEFLRDQPHRYAFLEGERPRAEEAVERPVILCEDARSAASICRSRWPRGPQQLRRRRRADTFPADGVSLESFERDPVQKALVKARRNKSLAAKLLGCRAALIACVARSFDDSVLTDSPAASDSSRAVVDGAAAVHV